MNKELNFLEKLVFQYLNDNFNTCISKQEYKIFNNKRYASLPSFILKEQFDLTNYKQRKILNKFVESGLISTKFGQAKERLYSFDESETLEIIYYKKEIRHKINKIKNIKTLQHINNLLEKIK
jgi:hypothetical protein